MSHNLKIKFISLGLLFLVLQPVFAQTELVKSAENPVLVKENNFYEGTAIGSPSVILINDTLRMVYAAGGTDLKGRINAAYSTDGTSWTKHVENPVLDIGTPGSWDDYFLDTPEIIQDSTGFKLYYFGDTDNDPIGSAFGVATSTDLINWTRSDLNPILSPGQPGEWDGLYIESPTVAFAEGTYYMLYSGIDTMWQVKIGLATSPDGINWTKFAGNPVLDGGLNTSWEGFSIATPSLLKTDTGFEVWYCGVSYSDMLDNNQIDTIKIGYASSSDAIHWVKYAGNPILDTYAEPYTSFETRGPWTPDVIYWADSAKYYMWYETAYGFGMASSPNSLLDLNEASPLPIFTISPNPATYSITANGVQIGDRLSIYNAMGVLIKEQTLSESTVINVSNLPDGIYFLSIQFITGEVAYKKLIKQ